MQFYLAMLTLLLLLMPAKARAQDVFGLLGTGAEAKAHAGAGVLASRNAAANYYNPANLGVSALHLDPYLSVEVINLSYTYGHPDYDPITLIRTTPVPFFGFTYRVIPDLTLGFSLLPLPGGSTSQKVLGLPTRALGEEPIIVDAETKGEGMGYRASMGGAYKITPSFVVGLSLLTAASKSILIADDADSGTTMIEESTSTSSIAAILGLRAGLFDNKLIAGFTIRPPSNATTKGEAVFPTLDGVTVDKSGKDKGPLGVGLAAEYKITPRIVPFLEFNYEGWGALRSQGGYAGITPATYDYFNTTDVVAGMEYRFNQHQISGAFGQYQSHLGDGIMADEADDGEELIGMEFQSIDAMPYKLLGAGYKFAFKSGYAQTGFSYLTGSREVWENARGYGNYTLKIISLFAGGVYRL
jgi:hypothetical protein